MESTLIDCEKTTMTSSKKPVAWVSKAMTDTTLIKGFTSELMEKDLQCAGELIERVARGKTLPSDKFPRKFFHNYKDYYPKSLPDFMQAGGQYLVSDRLRAVLETANLGATSFHSVELFRYHRATRIDLPYSIIAFGETKNTVALEQSLYRKGPSDGNLPELNFAPKDNDLTLSNQALLGPDLSIEENFDSAFFLSDRLVQALKAEKLTRRLGLRRCRISTEITA